MVIHGAWDGVAGLGDGSTLAVFPIMPVILGGGIALFFAVYRMTAAREKAGCATWWRPRWSGGAA